MTVATSAVAALRALWDALGQLPGCWRRSSGSAPPPWPAARPGEAVDAPSVPIPLYRHPDPDDFDEAEYLHVNPDVAAAVSAGAFPSGRAHFDLTGAGRTHRVRTPGALDRVREARLAKLGRIRPLLREGVAVQIDADGVIDCIDDDSRTRFGVVDTDNVSSNAYPPEVLALIDSLRDGLVLDCGAGSRDTYFPNVVNLEIARYPSTDVLAVAERLPFRDASFDAVLSIAVLEHVRYPFEAAAEICRVLRPGGTLYVVVPFLQPLHGYPSHYFNMTHLGLRSLFEAQIEVEQQFVGPTMGPIWAMHMIARDWWAALPAPARASLLDLRVADILRHPSTHAAAPYVKALDSDASLPVAAATGLLGRRRAAPARTLVAPGGEGSYGRDPARGAGAETFRPRRPAAGTAVTKDEGRP